MSDPQMQKIRALFEHARTARGRKTCLDLAEVRVDELIDRLPAESLLERAAQVAAISRGDASSPARASRVKDGTA